MEAQKARASQPPTTSPTIARGQAVQPARRWYYLDWLRVLAILTIFLYHIIKIFVIIIGLYEGVIVRVPFLRFVFGMKAISSTTRTPS